MPKITKAETRNATLSAVIVLMLAGWYLIRLIAARQLWDTLQAYVPQPGALYIALTGLGWSLLFGLAALGRYKPSSRFRRWLWPVFDGWLLWFWLDRLFLQHHQPAGGNNWLFLAFIQALCALLFWIEDHRIIILEGSTHQ